MTRTPRCGVRGQSAKPASLVRALDRRCPSVQTKRMKVARKSPKKRRATATRATLTLSRDVYHKIDELRGGEPRSVWVQGLIEREERQRQRDDLAAALREQYTAEVCRETLSVNDAFPVHEQ